MLWWKASLVVLVTGLVGACAAVMPNRVSNGQNARAAAAREFSCAAQDVRITDEELDVFLVEGCGQVATFYCAETRTLDMRCSRVDDAESVAVKGNLADAIAAQDKADTADAEAEAAAERAKPETSAAKQAP